MDGVGCVGGHQPQLIREPPVIFQLSGGELTGEVGGTPRAPPLRPPTAAPRRWVSQATSSLVRQVAGLVQDGRPCLGAFKTIRLAKR